MIGRWVRGKLTWVPSAAEALSTLSTFLKPRRKARRGAYRGGNNAITVDRDGRATTPQQRRKVVLRGKKN